MLAGIDGMPPLRYAYPHLLIAKATQLAQVQNQQVVGERGMVRSLVAFGWLRDFVIVLLIVVGNSIRHASPAAGFTVIMGAAVILGERFLWSWYLCGVKEQSKEPD